MNAESVCIDQTPVEVAGWSIPKIGNFPKHMLTLLDKFHQKINADWLVQSERMRLEYTMEGKELVQIPPPPTLLELKSIINFVRKQVFKIWITWPGADRDDKRGDVLDCLVNETKEVRHITVFENKIEAIANKNILSMMHEKGKHNLPRFQEINDIVNGTQTVGQKRKTKQKGRGGTKKKGSRTKRAKKAATGKEATNAATGNEATKLATKAATGNEATKAATKAATGNEATKLATKAATGNEATKLAMKAATGNEATKLATKAATGNEALKLTCKEPLKLTCKEPMKPTKQQSQQQKYTLEWRSLFTVDKSVVVHIEQAPPCQ